MNKKNTWHIVIWLIGNLIWSLYLLDAGMIAVPLVFVLVVLAPLAVIAIYVGSWYLIGFFFGKIKPHTVIIFVLSVLIVMGNWTYYAVKEMNREKAIESQRRENKIERGLSWVEKQSWDSEADRKYAMALVSYLQKDESAMNYIYESFNLWKTYNYENEPDTLEQYWNHGRNTYYGVNEKGIVLPK